jgi:hypothetical protein
VNRMTAMGQRTPLRPLVSLRHDMNRPTIEHLVTHQSCRQKKRTIRVWDL